MRARTRKLRRAGSWLLLLAALCSAVGYQVYLGLKQPPIVLEEPARIEEPPQPTVLESKALVVGDIFFGRNMDRWAQANELKYAYPFSGLQTFSREQYDVWIAGLECPVTDTPVPFELQATLFKYHCPPGYLPELAKWVDIVTIGNNHTDNQQEVDGFATTRAYLDKNGMQYFGHFDSSVLDELCEVSTITARPDIETAETYLVPVAFCGFNNVYRLPTEEELAVISRYSPYFLTIVYPQQGAEYQPRSDELKEEYFRRMIDLGADVVLGDQPHWVQNTEVYNGKLIAYSLGNFIFDQQFEPDVMRGLGVVMDMDFVYDDTLRKWQEHVTECTKFADDCLEFAKANKFHKIKFRIDYDIVVSDSSNQLTKKAGPEVEAAIRERTNWAETSEKLKAAAR